jgi:hypothetical protein
MSHRRAALGRQLIIACWVPWNNEISRALGDLYTDLASTMRHLRPARGEKVQPRVEALSRCTQIGRFRDLNAAKQPAEHIPGF